MTCPDLQLYLVLRIYTWPTLPSRQYKNQSVSSFRLQGEFLSGLRSGQAVSQSVLLSEAGEQDVSLGWRQVPGLLRPDQYLQDPGRPGGAT